MVAKLKSITRQIHWSLLLKSGIFAAAWLYLPFWLFFPVALFCYFIPSLRAGKLAVLFFTLIVLCFVDPPGLFLACIFGALFYYLLLIKDLLIIDRTSARTLLVMALSFFLFREFYATGSAGMTGGILFYALLIAFIFSLMLDNIVLAREASLHPTILPGSLSRSSTDTFSSVRGIIGLFSFVLVFQCLVVGLFLPLDFIYQSVLIFLAAALIIDWVPNHLLGILSKEKVRLASVVFCVMFILVLVSARWGL
jgi:hypothetical protein